MAHNPHDGPYLVVGPLLRYVGDTCATVWVETDRPCTVEVLGHRAETWGVHGHHYALVVVEGLQPDTETPYTVRLDGAVVWPEPGSSYPPSVIRTLGDERRLRLAFGSCRRAAAFDRHSLRSVGADALVALAQRMAGGDRADWPQTLLLLGDQVYADEPSPALTTRLSRLSDLGRRRHEWVTDEVRDEIVDFEEYTWLYHESWRTPDVRWLLSTVPTAMVLDDHDLRDDWNSSWSWRQEMQGKPWWRDRVQGAFASYWVYQHLGNLSPEHLAEDDVYRRVRQAPDDDTREQVLADMAWRADHEPSSARWSFVRDLGRTRLVVVDSRCSRRLTPGNRAMVDDTEWAWVEKTSEAEVDHLLLGTSLPFLTLHGIHHLEGWDEAMAEQGSQERAEDGAQQGTGNGRRRLESRVAERLRLSADLEHWPAFRRSFDAMVRLVQDVASGGRPPASVLWLSGDVHCSYLARARIEGVDPGRTAVHQLTMSPFRNPLEPWLRLANRVLERRPVVAVLAWLARRAGVVEPPLTWDVHHGPWFGNGLMTLVVEGRSAAVEVEQARVVGGLQVLERTYTGRLTP
ncbi:MAG TPA: alkaline phosphatase D family protein [Actinomycetales bacterium]|nr:alkaline phosphatase D family protein [Actinomycetales bacterium]